MTLHFPPKTLAIDFGTVRIGLAISRGTLAEPLMIIPNTSAAFETLAQVCAQEQVEQVVIGLSENTMAELTRVFAQQVAERLKLPIIWHDETLSSHTTHQRQKELKQPLSKRRQPIDHLAAATFLQEWLDEQ